MPSASNQGGHNANAITDTGARKGRTLALIDRARALGRRRAAAAIATRRGGSPKGGGTRASSHPGQAGGVPPEAVGRRSVLEPGGQSGVPRGRGLVNESAGEGTQRTGTSREGDRSRRTAQGGSRTDDRSR
jgi:hypothetical protein